MSPDLLEFREVLAIDLNLTGSHSFLAAQKIGNHLKRTEGNPSLAANMSIRGDDDDQARRMVVVRDCFALVGGMPSNE